MPTLAAATARTLSSHATDVVTLTLAVGRPGAEAETVIDGGGVPEGMGTTPLEEGAAPASTLTSCQWGGRRTF